MSDEEVIDMEQELEEFNIPKQFNVDELDNELTAFISSSESDDIDDEEDYLAQIENNQKVQEWWDKNKKQDGKPKKRKRNETNDDIEDDKNENKYSQLMEMEQSTSGLNLDCIRESILFREFRVIGLVCNDVPFCYQRLGDSFFIGTSIGKSFQVYEGKSLRLKISGRSTSNNISAMIMDHELTFTAVSSNIEIWYRVKKVGVITKHREKVYIMKLIGHLLITIGADRKMYIWDMKRLLNRKFDIGIILSKPNGRLLITKPVKTIDFNPKYNAFVDDEDIIECICHPPTYLNKILIGYRSGKMQLWNINTTQHIYTFKNHLSSFDTSAKSNSAISVTCIESSPILDVVAIGYSNGYIVIHNVKTDEIVMRFEHFNNDTMNGRINGLTFRNDGVPYLVSVGSDRNIVIWDLKQRKLSNIYYHAHRDRIVSAKFIENENILVTSSADNSLKMWIFDDDDDDYGNRSGRLRLLKQRSGHSSAPHLCSFHGRKALLSTANDHTLRVSWIQRDIQCLSMGQRANHNHNKHNVPRIKAINSAMSKSRFWSNVVTVHNNDNVVRLWNTGKFRLEEKKLKPLYDNIASRANASAAIISHCGNFAYVGRISGVIDKYNIQSAIHRLQIPSAHKNIIRSLHLSQFNNVLISIGGDGFIKFWNTTSGKCQHVIEELAHRKEVISCSCYSKQSNLLAVATDNLLVFLYDASNGKLIRKFNLNKHGVAKYYAHITAMIFSPRCQWLLISTMDGSVRVFDLSSGLIIDWFQFQNAVTSMSFAGNNTFLATTHCNTMGIHIWANKHHFAEPFLTNVGNKPIKMDAMKDADREKSAKEKEIARKVEEAMKKAIRFTDDEEEEESESESSSSLLDSDLDDVLAAEEEEEDEDEFALPDIASLHLRENNELITMSSNPKAVWKNMGNWDLILQRNRPSTNVKKNVANIPFFIPTKKHHRYLEIDTSSVANEWAQNQKVIEETMKVAQYKKRKKVLEAVNVRYKIDEKEMFDKYETCSTLIYFIKKEQEEEKEKERKYVLATKYLLSLNPSASDAEIHCIGMNIGSSKTEFMLAINFFIAALETNRNFEHIQSFISLFFKVHCDLIIKHAKSLHFGVVKLQQLIQQKWNKINSLFQSNLCLVQFYSRIQQ